MQLSTPISSPSDKIPSPIPGPYTGSSSVSKLLLLFQSSLICPISICNLNESSSTLSALSQISKYLVKLWSYSLEYKGIIIPFQKDESWLVPSKFVSKCNVLVVLLLALVDVDCSGQIFFVNSSS